MQLNDLRAPVADDLTRVDAEIRCQLDSDVALVSQISEYIVASGGKRLRPLAVVLAARAAGAADERHIRAAAVIEFIHTATLLHDDVVDESHQRRGRNTANDVFGNTASVLVGDFLYSRAFQMMVSLGLPEVMRVMADATNIIASGEVMQLMNAGDPDTTEQRYLEVIYRKTARLFEAGTQVAAIVAGAPGTVGQALKDYGRHLGIAFQLVDDSLDYRGDATELGKNLGDDLAEGKPTLPLIHALRNGTPEQAGLIRRAIEEGGTREFGPIRAAIESTGGLDYTARLARSEADLAIQALAGVPESAYRDSLAALAEFAVNRNA
ncbi:MAG: octaprenyl diphosphate synthase [Proteobacteria bacterium]|nr:octaprenyl diphosphate synthase [Pseudomonadota bacterium]